MEYSLAKTLQEEEQHYAHAVQLATSVSLPMVLMAAIRLELLEIIAEAGPGAQLSPSQIAAQLSPSRLGNNTTNTGSINHPANAKAANMLDRMLRLLASHAVLTCSSVDNDDGDDGGSKRVYGLTPVAKHFVRNKKGGSLGPFLELNLQKVIFESWCQLGDAVVEGKVPFESAHGINVFEYPRRDPKFGETYNEAMIQYTTTVMDRILENYQGFAHVKALVDVGGNHGVTLNAITTKWPNVRGINFDLPNVIQCAPAYPGVEHVAGDMFESVPAGDAIFLKWVLHDWDDAHCLKLLKNCYKALPENGKVIVVDAILPMTADTSEIAKANCQSDVLMMSHNPGGKERTQPEFLALATAAGFRGLQVECFVCCCGVMELYK